jgi:hypothetical protein
MRTLTYCSFATEAGCLGICIFDGELDPVQACRRAWSLKINPGGELMAVSFSVDTVPPDVLSNMLDNLDKLLPKETAVQLFDAVRVGDQLDQMN